ncbi:hypothetical protein [Streptomyces sp. NPDC048142]|uniref:hypothetical protein n=1 Tax=Streptomyces sp. NPDC048142 TaxID=3365501 RepID=UPI00371FA010
MSEQSPYGASSGGWSHPPPPAAPEKRRRWPWILLVAVLLLIGGCVAVVALVADEVVEESERTVRVRYEVTGTAEGVSIAYTTWRDGRMSISQVTSQRLPWTKEVTTKGFVKGGSLGITVGASGGTAVCSVTVDDGSPHTATASGAFANALCRGF